MDLRQRIKDEDKRKSDEEQAREERRKELLLTNPVKLRSKELIPVVGAFLKEMAKSFGLIVEREPESVKNPYCVYNYNVYRKDPKSWFFFPKKGLLLFSVTIGTVIVEQDWTTKEWKVKNVSPIEIFHHDSYYNETKSIGKYFIPDAGIDEDEAKKWLEDVFFEKRHLFA